MAENRSNCAVVVLRLEGGKAGKWVVGKDFTPDRAENENPVIGLGHRVEKKEKSNKSGTITHLGSPPVPAHAVAAEKACNDGLNTGRRQR